MYNWRFRVVYYQCDGSRACEGRGIICETEEFEVGSEKYRARYFRQVRRFFLWLTGYLDAVFRSTGFGSLEIWIRHLRKGITFQQTYTPSRGECLQNAWTGSAFVIGGGYVWGDVYAAANARNLVVVGGGDPVRESTLALRLY